MDILGLVIKSTFKTLGYMLLAIPSLIFKFNAKKLLLLPLSLLSIQYVAVYMPFNKQLQILSFVFFIYTWRFYGKNFYERSYKNEK